MNLLIKYIADVLGFTFRLEPISEKDKSILPVYLTEEYTWYWAEIEGKRFIACDLKGAAKDGVSVSRIEKHFNLVRSRFHLPVIAVVEVLESYTRKRFIQKRIGFIVPDKQLYIPEFFIDLREYAKSSAQVYEKLLPMAQLLLIHQILNHDDTMQIEKRPYKELAKQFVTNAMAITRAVDNLKGLGFCAVEGTKEKYILFQKQRTELWQDLLKYNLDINPVVKCVFVDEKPQEAILLAGASALPGYSDMNPSRQEYYAIDKAVFYALQKQGKLINPNGYEGKYCLEVWKYDPLILTKEIQTEKPMVDPLSLYLSLKDSQDERIEIALKQIEDKYIW